MGVIIDKSAVQKQTKIIGRAWKNVVPPANTEGVPNKHAGTEYITFKLNRGVSITIDDRDRLTLWPNDKRTGINARTGKEFVDADFSIGMQVEVAA